jgi:DNA modification methylase
MNGQDGIETAVKTAELPVFSSNLLLPRHRWYEFKEGFSEELVISAIAQYSARTQRIPKVLDPFLGSGTTLITSGKLGVAATGIEVNPFIAYSARAKCADAAVQRGALKKKLSRVLSQSINEMRSPLEGVSTFTERAGVEKWLFNRSVLRGFTSLDNALKEERTYRSPFRLALIAALMDCCNAFQDGKCLRYKSRWQTLGFNSSDLRDRFEERAKVVIDDLIEQHFVSDKLKIVNSDSREALKAMRAKSHDLVITSPPYLNSFDYSDVYRPEMFAGGFVKNNEQLRKIRLRTVRSHVQVGWDPDEGRMAPSVRKIVSNMREKPLWDNRLPDMVRSYFSDLTGVLGELKRIVKPNGELWMVVATSAYSGIHIEVDKVLGEIGERLGWRLRAIEVLRQLRGSGQQWTKIAQNNKHPLRESLIVFEGAA